MRKSICLFLLLSLPFLASAQSWKVYRYNFVFGIGPTSFLGDLGGSNLAGSHLLNDLNMGSTRYAASGGLRFKISAYTSVRGNFTLGRLSGSDQIKNVEFNRAYRRLNFRTTIAEANFLYEASFMKEQSTRSPRMRGVKKSRGYIIHVNGFAGVGMFYFDPAGEELDQQGNGTGKWHKLRPLHTEGQTLLASRPKTYSNYQLCIPIGLAFNMRINKRWNATLEYGLRYTFTDYIDDVSTVYVDPLILKGQSTNGELAAKMANKTTNAAPSITAPGAQRGDPRFTDAYMFAIFSLNYKLKANGSNMPKF